MRFAGSGMKDTQENIQNWSISLSVRAILGVKIVLGKYTHLLDPAVRKMLVTGYYRNANFMFDSGP